MAKFGSTYAYVWVMLVLILGTSDRVAGQQTQWSIEQEKDNIRLFSEPKLDARPVWQQLSDVAQELEEKLGIRTNGSEIQVILFRDHASYLRYLTPRLPQAKNRKALFYRNGEISQIYAYQSRSLMIDLRHEMTHVLVHQHLPYAALWLDEGLAEYFEENPLARESSSRISTVRWRSRTGRLPSLRSLEAIPKAEAMGEDEYRDSWAWICFFMSHSEQSREVLRDYLHEIHRGEAPEPMSSFAVAKIPGVYDSANSYFKKMTVRVALDSSR